MFGGIASAARLGGACGATLLRLVQQELLHRGVQRVRCCGWVLRNPLQPLHEPVTPRVRGPELLRAWHPSHPRALRGCRGLVWWLACVAGHFLPLGILTETRVVASTKCALYLHARTGSRFTFTFLGNYWNFVEDASTPGSIYSGGTWWIDSDGNWHRGDEYDFLDDW